jgi:hypothetical protein
MMRPKTRLHNLLTTAITTAPPSLQPSLNEPTPLSSSKPPLLLPLAQMLMHTVDAPLTVEIS